MNRTLKKELKEKWKQYIISNPKLNRTLSHHHYIRTRFASRFWLKEIEKLINK